MCKIFHLILTLLFSMSVFAQNIELKRGEEKTVPLMGYNAHMNNAPKWNDTQLIKGIQNLSANTLRFPGGSNSFYWDWEKGRTLSYHEFLPTLKNSDFTFDGKSISSAQELKSITAKVRKTNSFWRQLYRYNAKSSNLEKIEDFAASLKNNKAEGVFTLNLISSNVNKEMEMLRQAKKIELDIQYIEIGNEINSNNLITKHFYPNPNAYVDTCVNWMRKIWKEFPNIHIGIVGGNNNSRLKNWNELLVSAFQKHFSNKSDQIHFVLHYYSYFKNPIYNFQDEMEYQQLVSFPKLDLSQKLKWWHWQATSDYTTWATEFNMIEPKPWNLNNKWVQGLYVSSQINEIISQTNTEMLHFHSIGSSTFPVFASLDMMSKDSRYMQMTANGLVTSLWNRLSAKADHFQSIKVNFKKWKVNYPSRLSCDCPNNPKRPTTIEFNPVHAYLSKVNNKQKLLITNLSKEEITINISDLLKGIVTMEQYSGNLDLEIPNINKDRLRTTIKEVSGEITIPALSISLFEE